MPKRKEIESFIEGASNTHIKDKEKKEKPIVAQVRMDKYFKERLDALGRKMGIATNSALIRFVLKHEMDRQEIPNRDPKAHL